MASNGALAEYFLKIGLKIDKAELKKIDSLLKSIEQRLGGVGKAQVAEAKATDTATKATKRRTKAEVEQQKAVKDANKVALHQQKLRANWLKQQDQIAASAKKVHDQQMKMMRQAQAVSNANAKQEVKNAQTIAKTASAPRSALTAKQIGANRRAWLNSTRGIEVRTGYNKQYRLGEQQAANAAKGAAERVAAEKEANKKIEQERKQHADRISRIENSKLIHQRAMERVYGTEAAKRRLSEQAQQNWLERQRVRQEMGGGRSAASYSRANFLHAGGAGGAIARYGAGALPFVGGVYGLASLNTANQQIQANDLAMDAVAGSKAAEYKKYINDLGNRLGMTTRQLQPSFTQYLAGAQGTALEGTIKQDFASFTQYGAVMGLGPDEMKGSLRAINQMISKQQIYAEELRGQLAERMPAAVRIMADAVTGGDTKALIKKMADGQLDPNEVLPLFFNELKARSESSLGKYFEGSRFAQGRMNKSFEDLLKLFSKSGGESAFAKIFNTIADGAQKSEPLVRGLTGAFENLAEFIKVPVSLFEDLNSVLEETSRVSGISEGSLTTLALVGGLMASKWGRVAAMFASFLVVLQDISYGVQGKDSYTKDVITWFDSLSGTEKHLMAVAASITAIGTALVFVNKQMNNGSGLPDLDKKGGPGRRRRKGNTLGGFGDNTPLDLPTVEKVGFGAALMESVFGGIRNNPALAVALGLGTVAAAAGAPVFDGMGGVRPGLRFVPPPTISKNAPVNGIFPMGYTGDPAAWASRVSAVGDPNSPYYNDPKGYDAERQDSLTAMREQGKTVTNQFSGPLVQLDVRIDGSAETEVWVKEKLSPLIEGVMDKIVNQSIVNFPSR